MKLGMDRLPRQLAEGLAPLYLIAGDEPLLVQEACDQVRAAARAQGCGERVVMHVEAGFDWNGLLQEAGGLSLFAERRLLELRLPSGRPGEAGGRVLQAYAQSPPPDTTLLVVSGRIEASAQRSRWFKAVEQAGVVVQVWPVGPGELPAWIARRLRSAGLEPQREAVQLLAQRLEGNLLAAVQEIEKLRMLHGQGPVTAEDVLAAVADSAHYDAFLLTDAALAGDQGRVSRILDSLRREGIEPLLILWTLVRELRAMALMASRLEEGAAPAQVLAGQRVWERRRPLVRAALRRHGRKRWLQFLRRAAAIERIAKGRAAGNVWDELLQLSLAVAGVAPVTAQP